SMATPHIVGAAAQYLTANPNATPQQVRDALVGGATDGVVNNPGSGSPNKLLNVSFIGGGDPGPDPGCGVETATDDVRIPDAGDAVSSTIEVSGCEGDVPASLPVKVDVNHTYTADLDLALVSPDGTEYGLHKARGVGEPNGIHTTFTVNPAAGEKLNGTWKLTATDVYRFDEGVIDSWSLTLGSTTNAANYEGGTRSTTEGASAQFYNGEDATVSEFPAIIAGLREGGPRPQGQSCTGSVIAPRKVLIAAHCADAAGEKTFLYGLDDLNDSGGFRTEVVEYKKHPDYVNFDQGYDVAVVTVADDIPVPGGEYASFATSADEGIWQVGDDTLGFGYGKKDHDDASKDVTLDKATLPIVHGERQCQGVGAGFKAATMICAGYADGRTTILPGDSGGPLIVDAKIVGLASWSRADFRWYGVYSRLDNDMGDWVREQVGDTPPPTGDFGVGVQPSSVSAAAGKYVSATVTTTAGDAGDEDLTLSASSLPSGAKATFQPASVTTGSTAKVTFETASDTPGGEHKLTVTGTGSGGKTATAPVTLTVGDTPPPGGDVKLTLSRDTQSVPQGQLASTKVTASGGTGQLSISATGAPAGSQVFVTPSTVAQGGTAEIWVFTSFQTPPGSYPITVKATSADGKSGTARFTVAVTRFGF
ncbi:MAG: trypsin-like serine protease, partial [Thermocrispum sp.]